MKLKTELGDKPLWSQVYDIIIERINNGVYPRGSILPAEVQLMEEFGVSRITVRQAMDKLISEELISRKRGKGTIVLEKKDTISTIFQSSFSNVTEMQTDMHREIISIKMVSPSAEVKFGFNITDDQKVLELVRMNKDNTGDVLTIHYSYINPIAGVTLDEDYSDSLYKVMAEKGYPIESVIEEISASIINKQEKKIFKIKRDVAIISRLRKGFNNGNLVEYSISKYNAEGYTLIINNK